MNQAAIRLHTREQTERDRNRLLVQGKRLARASLATIERTGNSIIRSRARLVLSRVRLGRSHRRLLKRRGVGLVVMNLSVT